MQRIGRANVDGIHLWILENLLKVRFRPLRAELLCELTRRLQSAVTNRANIHAAKPANRLRMHATHKASTNDCRSKFSHVTYTHHAAAGGSRGTICCRKVAARPKPSSGESKLSSCSIDST